MCRLMPVIQVTVPLRIVNGLFAEVGPFKPAVMLSSQVTVLNTVPEPSRNFVLLARHLLNSINFKCV